MPHAAAGCRPSVLISISCARHGMLNSPGHANLYRCRAHMASMFPCDSLPKQYDGQQWMQHILRARTWGPDRRFVPSPRIYQQQGSHARSSHCRSKSWIPVTR